MPHLQERLQSALEEDQQGFRFGHVLTVRVDQSEAFVEGGTHHTAEDLLRASSAKRTGNRAANERAGRTTREGGKEEEDDADSQQRC